MQLYLTTILYPSAILIIIYVGKTKTKRLQLPLFSPFFDKHFHSWNNTSQRRYMFVWLEAMKQYVFHICFNFPVKTMVQIRYWASIALYRFIPVVLWNAIQYNNSTVLVSASIMDQHCTGWRRFHSNIRYRHMTVTPAFVVLARFIEHVIHTHDRYEMYTGEW